MTLLTEQSILEKPWRELFPLQKTPISHRIVSSKEYEAAKRGILHGRFRVSFDDIDFKTLLSISGTGFAPANNRTDMVSVYPQRRAVIADLIPQDNTQKQAIKFVRETIELLAAVPTAEGAAKPESRMVFEEVTAPVVKVPAWIPVTEEQLLDVEELRSLIDRRLLVQCLIAEEDELMNGAGGSGAITGFYNQSGVQTQTLGADTLADAIFKALSKVRHIGNAEPTAVLINPDDYESERLRKDDLGNYIWGPPTLPPPAYIWEMPAVVTNAVTAGQPLVGDFCMAHISRRSEGQFAVSYDHSDYFINNILALRAELRTSLEILRPSAFCYVES